MNNNLEIRTYIKPLVHIIIWVIVLQLLFDITGLYYSFRELFIEGENHFDEAFLILPLLLSLFYWNSEYLIPKYLKKETWWKYVLGLVFSFLTLFFLANFSFKLLINSGFHLDMDAIEFSDLFIFFEFFVLAISSSLGFSKIALKNVRQKKEAVEKQKEAEMKFLTAQVNPHFLFNTLNSIYSLATIEDAPKTTEAILSLSEIMRYPLNEGIKKKVKLSGEIQFLRDYIDLQKIRIGEDYPVVFEVEGDIEKFEIPPLLFISFVENAFKYGISQRTKKEIFISIKVHKNTLSFKCINDIIKAENITSHKVGLQNIQERLELFSFPYKLVAKEKEERFFVDLNIVL